MGIATVCFTALLGELALNPSVADTNLCLLRPARSSINRWAPFGRVYVNLWKVQHCRASFDGDFAYR